MREVVETFADIGGFSTDGPNLVTFMLLDPPQVMVEGVRSMRRALSCMRRHEDFRRAQELQRLKGQGR